MSLAPRAVMVSLPFPPSRTSPSPQTKPCPTGPAGTGVTLGVAVVAPASGQKLAAEAATIGGSGVGKVVTSRFSPEIRATPAGSSTSQPVKPAPATVDGAVTWPLM